MTSTPSAEPGDGIRYTSPAGNHTEVAGPPRRRSSAEMTPSLRLHRPAGDTHPQVRPIRRGDPDFVPRRNHLSNRLAGPLELLVVDIDPAVEDLREIPPRDARPARRARRSDTARCPAIPTVRLVCGASPALGRPPGSGLDPRRRNALERPLLARLRPDDHIDDARESEVRFGRDGVVRGRDFVVRSPPKPLAPHRHQRRAAPPLDLDGKVLQERKVLVPSDQPHDFAGLHRRDLSYHLFGDRAVIPLPEGRRRSDRRGFDRVTRRPRRSARARSVRSSIRTSCQAGEGARDEQTPDLRSPSTCAHSTMGD